MGHALAGIISLLFSITNAVIGAMLVGRIRRTRGINLLKLHRRFSVYLGILVLGAFFSGLWARISRGELLFWQHFEPLATVIQGWFGLVVTIMAIMQVAPCFVVKDRRKIRKLHMILGYVLVIALVIQTFLGVEAALIEIASG